jgi:YNFM family putative membrane transporter
MAEEIDPDSLGLATGVYIAGSVFGGMSGRLVAGLLADYLSWRVALGTLGTVSLCGAAYCLVSLPPSQQHRPQHRAPSEIGRRYLQPLQDAGLPWIFFGGFLLMGAFVTLYNYMTFRLLAAPYRLSQSAASWIFSIYLIGMASSTIAGALAGRLGRRKLYWPAVSLMLVGVLCTLAGSLWIVVPGIGLVTFGFFAAHSLASSWVSLRGRECRAQAASLYLCSFYLGSSVAGSLGGLVWSRHGWNGVVLMVALMVAGAFLVSLRLARLPPLPRGPVATDAVTVSG